MLLFNISPTLYCHFQGHMNKKPHFSCRGCNSMLSEPIVLQKLHLFFSCIVYWRCGSGKRLDGHNYAASQTSKTAFPYTWISVFLEPKVRKSWINLFILFGYGPQSFMLTLQLHSVYSYIFMQIWWTGLSTGLATVFLFVWPWFLV